MEDRGESGTGSNERAIENIATAHPLYLKLPKLPAVNGCTEERKKCRMIERSVDRKICK